MTDPTDNAVTPSHEQITTRAELLWKAKGNPQGQDEQIWLEAERQLAQESHENEANSASSHSPSPSQPEVPNSVAEEQMVERLSPKPVPKTASRKKSSGR